MPAATSAAPLCEAGRNTSTNSTTTIIKIGDDGDDSDGGDGGDDGDDGDDGDGCDCGDDGDDGEDGGDSRPEMAGRRWPVRGRRSEVASRRLEVGDGRSEVAGLPNANITTNTTIIAIIAYGLEIEQFRCKLLQMGPPAEPRTLHITSHHIASHHQCR